MSPLGAYLVTLSILAGVPVATAFGLWLFQRRRSRKTMEASTS